MAPSLSCGQGPDKRRFLHRTQASLGEPGAMSEPKLSHARAKYTVLLVLLVCVAVVPGAMLWANILNELLILVLVACVMVIGKSRNRFLAASVLCLFPLISMMIPVSARYPSTVHLFLQIAFLSYATIMVLIDVFAASEVNLDKLAGSVCAYLLVALVFGFAYIAIETEHPGSFLLEGHRLKDFVYGETYHRLTDLGYFSLVTLATLGYGDIVAVTPLARSIAVLEAIFGQFYMVVLVGRLLALYMHREYITHERNQHRSKTKFTDDSHSKPE